MSDWKNRISRITFSAVSIAIISGIGAFAGAIVGGLFELLSLAIFNTPLPTLELILASSAVGLVTALIWGLRVLYLSYRPAPTATKHTGDTQPIPISR